LELILDTSDAKKLHIGFQDRNGFPDLLFSIFHFLIGLGKKSKPFVVLFLSDELLCDNKCSEPFSCEIFTFFVNETPLRLGNELFHDDIGAF
jgi:hypothetical protein